LNGSAPLEKEANSKPGSLSVVGKKSGNPKIERAQRLTKTGGTQKKASDKNDGGERVKIRGFRWGGWFKREKGHPGKADFHVENPEFLHRETGRVANQKLGFGVGGRGTKPEKKKVTQKKGEKRLNPERRTEGKGNYQKKKPQRAQKKTEEKRSQ